MALKSAKINQDSEVNRILSLIGQGGKPLEIKTGIYLSNSFSFGRDIKESIKEEYPDLENGEGDYLNVYGVCDSIENWEDKYKAAIESPDRFFCVAFTKVAKSEQSESGGWRWHKWGPYIGEKDPQCEYLYDEGDDIQEVYVFHVYELD